MPDPMLDIRAEVLEAAREVSLQLIEDAGYTVSPYAGGYHVRGAHFSRVFAQLEFICPSQLRPNWRTDFEDVEPNAVDELENLSFFGGEYDYAD